MKVKEVDAKFRPITIVVKTKKEAIALWHRLNAGNHHFIDYARNKGIDVDDINCRDIFSDFNAVFYPGNQKKQECFLRWCKSIT